MTDATNLKAPVASSDGRIRGGLGFLGGLALCSAALIAQAALLHAVAKRKPN